MVTACKIKYFKLMFINFIDVIFVLKKAALKHFIKKINQFKSKIIINIVLCVYTIKLCHKNINYSKLCIINNF